MMCNAVAQDGGDGGATSEPMHVAAKREKQERERVMRVAVRFSGSD